jgi:thioredoxin 1
MDEDIEDIRRQKIAELRNRHQPDDGGAPATPAEPIPIDGPTALEETVSEHQVVLVDFYADWCGPCQMLEPVVETIAAETDATVGKVDIDANQDLAQEYGVRGVPTLVLFANGEPVERLVGMQDDAQLRAVVAEYT